MVHESEEALNIIEDMMEEQIISTEDADLKTRAMVSSLQLLRGQVYESRDNRPGAADCYKEAVRTDLTCVEAMTSLTSHQMLTLEEERDLVQTLASQTQPRTELSQLVTYLYGGSLKKYSEVKLTSLPLSLASADTEKWSEMLSDNSDVRVSELERLYYNCDYHAALRLSTAILKADPHHPACLPIHVALLVELEKTSDLFKLSHSLVDLFPEWCVAWYAVGRCSKKSFIAE